MRRGQLAWPLYFLFFTTCLGAIGRDVPWLTKYHLRCNLHINISRILHEKGVLGREMLRQVWQAVSTSLDKSLRMSLSPAGTEMVLVRGLLGSDGGREAWRVCQMSENQLIPKQL